MAKATQNPKERAERYVEFGTNVAASIRDAVYQLNPTDAEELLVYSARIDLCNARTNQWYGTDLHNAHGECYDGSGRFWHCGSKHCSWCLKRHVNRCRKLTNEAVARQKLFVGEHWTFLTLTTPNDGGEILERRELINLAWAIFRKSKWFQRKIIGAAKNEELALTKAGHHYHIHCVARTKYIDYKEFRQAWTAAVTKAFRDLERPLTINTSDKLAIANAERIGSLREAVNEVCKYFTKACSWSQMNETQLLNSCRIRRWPRMFELIGSFKPAEQTDDADTSAEDMDNTILDERSISEPEKEQPWRQRVRDIGGDNYLAELIEYWRKQVNFRTEQLRKKYHAANLYKLRGPPPIDPQDIIRRVNELRRQRLATAAA